MKKALFLALLASLLFAPAMAQDPRYVVRDRIHIEGDGGWDYLTVDEAANILYVSHGNKVDVVDAATKKTIAVIEDTKGVHGIAIAAGLGKGYISCGRDSSVLVFDTKTYKPLTRIKVNGANPDAILFDPFSKKVFAFNGRSKNVTVIDTRSDKVAGDIPLSGKPEFAVTNEAGKVYVNIEDKNTICVINTQSLKVEQYWPLTTLDEPSGLAIDNATHRLFSVSDGHMAVVDAQNGKTIATLPIGDRVDGVAFDRDLKRAVSANGDGTITVVEEMDGAYRVTETTTTQKGARTIAINSVTHHVYLPTADFGEPEAGSKRPSVKAGTFVVLEITPGP